MDLIFISPCYEFCSKMCETVGVQEQFVLLVFCPETIAYVVSTLQKVRKLRAFWSDVTGVFLLLFIYEPSYLPLPCFLYV